MSQKFIKRVERYYANRYSKIKASNTFPARLERNVFGRKLFAACQMKETYEKQVRELNSAVERKEFIIALARHEVFVPLNSIAGVLDDLNSGYENMADEERKDLVRVLAESSEATNKLARTITDWSRLTEEMKASKENIDVRFVADEKIAMLKPEWMRKNLIVRNAVPDDLKAFADQRMVGHIIQNLLRNAIKFTNEGGRIAILAYEKDGVVKVSVIDSGVGISKENIGKLFAEKCSFTTKGTNGEEGTGIGLHIVKDFVQMNGGNISVESNGNGTSFVFTLPLANQ